MKPGREGLQYRGPYSPITDLVLIATGLGVVPMIQMINELLPSSDSSVSTASGKGLQGGKGEGGGSWFLARC